MPDTRAKARQRMLTGAPEPVPVLRIEGLSAQHQIMVDHWFENGCKSQRAAAIAAGFAGTGATILFSRQAVRDEIERRRERMYRRAEITEARIIDEYAKIAFSSLGDMLEIQPDGSAWLDMAAMKSDQKAALAEYHVESYQELGDEDHPGHVVKKARIKFHDKKAALDSLSRIKGMFKDKLEIAVGLSLSEKVQQRRERLAVSRDTVIEGEIVHVTPEHVRISEAY